jgi:glucose-1-phosphate cytidylyltransferase
MVEIGGKPILWHIMSIYARHGFKDFLVACGYRSEMIKEYFHNYFIHSSDYIVNLKDGSRKLLNANGVDWRIGVVDTGLDTMTGGRILRLKPWLDDEPFMVTYGDGLGDVDIDSVVAFHRAHGKLATITAVRPPARFGGLVLSGDRVCEFSEKPQTGEGWINGGFFVFEPGVFEYLKDDQTILEREPLERLASEKQLLAFRHTGFWQPMDTLREKQLLESLWSSGKAPWKVW